MSAWSAELAFLVFSFTARTLRHSPAISGSLWVCVSESMRIMHVLTPVSLDLVCVWAWPLSLSINCLMTAVRLIAGWSSSLLMVWLLSESVCSSYLGWRPRYSGASWICTLIFLNCRIFWDKDRPIINTDAPVSMRAKVSMPFTVTRINQQPGWLTALPLISLEPSESEDDAKALHLDELDCSLDLVWERALFVRVLLVGKESGASACSPAFSLSCALLVGVPWCPFEPSFTEVWSFAFTFGSPQGSWSDPLLV